jgi:histone H3/H4
MVRKIEHHDGVSSGIFADKFHHKGPQEWTKQALKTLEEATEAYMVEVIDEASF